MAEPSGTNAYEYRPLPVDEVVYQFEKAWRAGLAPAIDDFLQGDGPDRWHLLVELAHSELELRLRAGEDAALADYLARYPALAHLPNEMAAVLETEVRVRAQRKEPPDLKAYEARYPGLGPRVRAAFRRAGAAPPEVPGYELLDELGRGGMGVVYRATQVLLKREVAVKLIRADRLEGTAGDRFRGRFRREAEAVAAVGHPHVVQVYDCGECGGDLYLAMELVEGGSLQRRLDADGVLAPRAAAELVETVARAVHAVHAKGIVHRDLKPDNVLLTAAGEPKVADFGLARPAELADGKTVAGVVVGTPEYMSPEQAAASGEDPTPRVDVYGVGAVLYACLTGRPPFPRGSVLDTLERVRTQPAVPVRQLRADCPRDLETVTLKCLEKDPARRYPTAEALADDLRRWLDGQPITARPAGPLEKGWKWANRNKRLAGMGLAVLLTMIVGSGTAAWFAAQADAQTIARTAAEGERDAKEELRLSADKQAEENAERAALLADLSKVGSSFAAWRDGNPARARKRLDEVAPAHRGWEWRYLDHTYAHPDRLIRASRNWSADHVRFLDGGRTLLTAGEDGTVAVWRIPTSEQLQQFDLGEAVQWLFVGPKHEEGRVLAISRNGKLLLGDLDTGRVICTAKASFPDRVIVSPDWDRVGVVTNFNGQDAAVFELATGKKLYPRAPEDHQEVKPKEKVDPSLPVPTVREGVEEPDEGGRGGGEADVWLPGRSNFLTISQDCRLVAEVVNFGDKQGTVRIAVDEVDSARSRFVKVVEPHIASRPKRDTEIGEVTASFSVDGTLLVVRLGERTCAFDTSKGEPCLLPVETGKVSPTRDDDLPLSERYLARPLGQGRVLVIDRTAPPWFRELPVGRFERLVLSPDSRHLAVLNRDHVSIWDVERSVLRFSHVRKAPVNFLDDCHLRKHWMVFSPDGQTYAVIEDESVATVRRVRDGAIAFQLIGHAGYVTQAVYSPDSETLLTHATARGEGDKGQAMLWNVKNRSQRVELAQRMTMPASIPQPPGLWGLAGPAAFSGVRAVAPLRGWRLDAHAGVVHQLVEWGGTHWVGRVDLATGRETEPVRLDLKGEWSAWGAKSDRVAVGFVDGSVAVHDAAGEPVRVIPKAHSGPITAVALNPEKGWLATVSVRKLRNAPPEPTMPGPEDEDLPPDPDFKAFQPPGFPGDHDSIHEGPDSRLPPRDGYAVEWAVWDLNDGRQLGRGELFAPWPVRVQFTDAGTRLLFRSDLMAVSTDGQGTEACVGYLRVIDWKDKSDLFTLNNGFDQSRLLLSDDATFRVTGDVDGTVRVTDNASGTVRLSVPAHTKWVTALAIDPDGRRLVTAGAEGSVRVWDLSTGLEVLALQETGGPRVTELTFSPDGTRLYGQADSGGVVTWRASPKP